MKASTLEAWQVYAARCRRLDAEEAKSAPLPWWVRHSVEELALLACAQLVLLAWVGGLL